MIGGQTFVGDSQGRVTVRLNPNRPVESQARVVVPPRIGKGLRAEFVKWYDRSRRPGGEIIATFNVERRVRLRYVDLDGRRVPTSRIGGAVLKASHGEVTRIPADALDDAVWLQSSRVVPLQGGLEVKPLYYTLRRVDVRGSSVVNRSQLKFFPSREQSIDVPLLFYSARFRAHDHFFGFGIGSAIELEFPDGKRETYAFVDGEVVIPSLPRGDYMVRVKAPGFSFLRPVAMSRDQDLDLEVLSYFDIAVVLLVGLGLTVGLLLVGRPQLLRWVPSARAPRLAAPLLQRMRALPARRASLKVPASISALRARGARRSRGRVPAASNGHRSGRVITVDRRGDANVTMNGRRRQRSLTGLWRSRAG